VLALHLFFNVNVVNHCVATLGARHLSPPGGEWVKGVGEHSTLNHRRLDAYAMIFINFYQAKIAIQGTRAAVIYIRMCHGCIEPMLSVWSADTAIDYRNEWRLI